jgi:hypothetical protein
VNVYFQILGPGPDVRTPLAHDGWEVEQQARDVLRASHPSVTDEEEARERLHRLGLLLSASLRIEFGPAQKSLSPPPGFTNADCRRQASLAGFSHFLSKPADLDEICGVLGESGGPLALPTR